MTCSLFRVLIGAGVPERVTDRAWEVYSTIAAAVLRERIEFEPSGRMAPCITVEEAGDRPVAIEELFRERMIALADGRSPKLVLIHIDFGNLVLIPNAEAALLSAVRQTALEEHFSETRFVLIRRELPPSGDHFRDVLRDVVESGRVMMLDSRGEAWMNSGSNRPDQHEIRYQLRRLNRGPLESVRARLCRVRGHFRRSLDGGDVCTKFFYDGRRCVAEIVELIEYSFAAELEQAELLLVDAGISFWLEDVAVLLAERFDLLCKNLQAPNELRHLTKEQLSRSVLLLPVVDTGQSLKRHLGFIRNERAVTPLCAVSVVINRENQEEAEQFDDVRLQKIDWEGLPLYYMLCVRRGLERTENCEWCRTSMVPTQRLEQGLDAVRIGLDGFSFWDMVAEAGPKVEEDDPPAWRQPLAGAPNFPGILAGEDGSSLAALLLESIGRGEASSLLLVGPDQAGARLLAGRICDQEPSAQVVLVPSNVIGRFGPEGSGQLSESDKSHDWYRRLRAASREYCRPLIIEEFCVSGGTAARLIRLLTKLGISPQAHVVAADFALGAGGQLKRCSPYGFNLGLVEGQVGGESHWQVGRFE